MRALLALLTLTAVQITPESSSTITPPRRPDLQGVWSNNTVTPFLRPKALADRAFLSDGEIAVLRERAARMFSGGGDTAPGEEMYEALLSNPTVYATPRRGGDYNQFWASVQLSSNTGHHK